MTDYTLALDTGVFTYSGSDAAPGWPKEIDDGTTIGDAAATAWTALVSMTENLKAGVPFSDNFNWLAKVNKVASWTDSMLVSQIATLVWRPGASISETIKLTSALAGQGSYNLTVQDRAKIKDLLGLGLTALITQGLFITETTSVIRALGILEAVTIGDRWSMTQFFSTALLETLLINPTLALFLGGELNDSALITSALHNTYVAVDGLQEQLDISSALGEVLMINITMDENLDVSTDQVLQMIYNGQLSELINVALAYNDPGGGFTSWALNARSGALTEYRNYDFNSFVQVNASCIGANHDGLYLLAGHDDDGETVRSLIAGGLMQLAGSRFTQFAAAYLGVRGAGEYFLRLTDGEGVERTYRVHADDLRTARINLGKGLRSRYFTYELESVGQEFDLTSIEFLPISSQRRI